MDGSLNIMAVLISAAVDRGKPVHPRCIRLQLAPESLENGVADGRLPFGVILGVTVRYSRLADDYDQRNPQAIATELACATSTQQEGSHQYRVYSEMESPTNRASSNPKLRQVFLMTVIRITSWSAEGMRRNDYGLRG